MEIAQKLVPFQTESGEIGNSVTTITNSRGISLSMETTAVSTLAWMIQKNNEVFLANVIASIKFIRSKCTGGSFGSTQGTILCLKAIIYFDSHFPKGLKEGSIIVRLDGKEVSSTGFDKSVIDTFTLPYFGDKITAGAHNLEIEMLEGSALPFACQITYNSLTPDSSGVCAVRLDAKLRISGGIKAGEGTEIEVNLKNIKTQPLPMVIAIIGIPGGLEPRIDSLKDLVKTNKIAFYELFGAREVVFYWRQMLPDEEIKFNFDVLAAIPGTYTGSASRAYLYYTSEHKQWIPGLNVTIHSNVLRS